MHSATSRIEGLDRLPWRDLILKAYTISRGMLVIQRLCVGSENLVRIHPQGQWRAYGPALQPFRQGGRMGRVIQINKVEYEGRINTKPSMNGPSHNRIE